MIKHEDLEQGRIFMSNAVRMLLYKEQPALIHKLDLDSDKTFLEPTMLAYFRERERCEFPSEMIGEYLQGYFLEKEEIQVNHSLNYFDVAYLPEIGYVKKGENKPFLPITDLEGTSIKLLRYPTPVFKNIMVNIPEEPKEHYDVLHEKHLQTLTNALQYIKKGNRAHYDLIEKCCSEIFVFNTDSSNSNSFATRKANGVAFLNAYQEDYDEVFFIDDIAHQTGHIILITLFIDPRTIYKIDEQDIVEDIIKMTDHRTVDVLVHALYTYYTTFICLDGCLVNNCFAGNEEQEREAIGRIGFYLRKCKNDLNRFRIVQEHYSGVDNMFTETGLDIINTIKNGYDSMLQKWGDTVANFDYSDQPYNFLRTTFLEKNKIVQKVV